ncbi:MAG: ATP-binding protein [Candidatus Promineifilaceae bacterium]|jgi:DNA-binding SARP family transcriptional activator
MRHVSFLGPVRVKDDQVLPERENPVEAIPRFRSRRTVGLLGYLVAERRTLARDHLASLFWPDEERAKGRANLSRELHNLARVLPDCWDTDRRAVSFVPSASTIVDIYELEELDRSGRWGEATEILGGEFLEGFYLDKNPDFEMWLTAERERWRHLAERVLRRLMEGYSRRGRYNDALHLGRRLVQLAPWDEESHRQLMRLYSWTGQRSAALRHFESCKEALRIELDVEPSSEMIALYQQIQDRSLDLPPQLPAFLTREKARHSYVPTPFVGRENELDRLDGYLTEALVEKGRVVFVTGGPGRGKTALLYAFARRAMAMHPELVVISGKCNAYTGVGDPYLPFREMLTILTGNVEANWDAGNMSRDHALRLWFAFPVVVQALINHGPHLINTFVPAEELLSRSMAAGQENAAWFPQLKGLVNQQSQGNMILEQYSLFQQIGKVLDTIANEYPFLLILDDLQWADTASISLLFHLGRQLVDNKGRLLILCAYRPEEVAMDRNGERHPLAKLLSEFKRTFGDVWLNLGQTEKAKSRRFLDRLLDIEPNHLGEEFREVLFEHTGGHPLFTFELLRNMEERGELLKDTDGAWIEGPKLDWNVLPARVEAVIKERISRLDHELQEFLSIACVEGELFTAQVVAKIGGWDEKLTLRRLTRELDKRYRLVKEEAEIYTDNRSLSRFRFRHILFQDYLYKQLGQGEQRLLHGEVAEALEELFEGQLDEMAVQLARNFYQANAHSQAFYYATKAAERAARLYKSSEAITHYTRAIQLASEVDPNVLSLTELYRGRGLANERLGDFNEAHRDHEASLEIARAAGEQKVAWRTLVDLGKLWESRDYNRTRDYFESALTMARSIGEPVLLAVSLNWMGNWHANNEDAQKAIIYHQEALSILEDLGKPQDLANTLDLLGIAHLLSGDLIASVHYYDRAIRLFRELDDRPRLTSSLIGRATTSSMLVFLASVSAPDASFDFDEVLRLADETGLASEKAWAHWSLGLLQILRGQLGHALNVIQDGLRIATEIGHREYVLGNRFALGFLYAELFAPDLAKEQLEEALSLARELNSSTWFRLVSGVLAGVYYVLDDLETASAYLDSAIMPHTPMDTLGKRYCWVRRAELALACNDPSLAADIIDRLIASAPGMAPGGVITFLWKLKAEALAANGHIENACALLRSAIMNAEATGERILLWRLHADLGHFYRTIEQDSAAEKEYSAARALIDEMASMVPNETLKVRFLQGVYRKLPTRRGVW